MLVIPAENAKPLLLFLEESSQMLTRRKIMRTTITGLLAILGLLLLSSGTSSANEGSIAFVGARIIDGTRADPIEDGVVVITDGRIRTVGPRSAVTVPAGAQIIDVAGKTIMPGIINAHGHVGGTLGLEGGHYNTDNLLRLLPCVMNSSINPWSVRESMLLVAWWWEIPKRRFALR